FINKIIEENEIDCDFSWQPSYIYTNSEEYIEQIQNEVKTASALGIKASYQEETPLPFKVKAAVRFDGQAQFHPRKYLLALAAKIPGQGSNIFEQTKAVDIEEENGCTVITDSGIRVHASKVIIASHYPFYDKPGLYFTRIYPDRSYILAVRAKSKYPGGMYINAEQPARSLRSQPYENGELILVGGEHHKTGHGENTNQHYENLLSFAEDTFGVISVPYRWSTQDCMTMDGVPYIGHLTSNKKDIYVATGFQKWGMTSSTVSALIIRDLIMEGDNPWKEVFDPSRTTIAASAKNFIKENADVAGNFISGKLMSVPENLDVKKGEGKIMDIDGYKTGVYRDSDDKLHFVDTSCTHLGCGLKWNDAEKTWDCPCHGSRFGYTGDIVEGPALKSIGIELKEKMYS
ncbi:MAG: FAD-dependent oxidoreductase, partial [Bacillota bacterium]|nr:FAD-dependent oxidoreductase [Bacillota bacterium]